MKVLHHSHLFRLFTDQQGNSTPLHIAYVSKGNGSISLDKVIVTSTSNHGSNINVTFPDQAPLSSLNPDQDPQRSLNPDQTPSRSLNFERGSLRRTYKSHLITHVSSSTDPLFNSPTQITLN